MQQGDGIGAGRDIGEFQHHAGARVYAHMARGRVVAAIGKVLRGGGQAGLHDPVDIAQVADRNADGGSVGGGRSRQRQRRR